MAGNPTTAAWWWLGALAAVALASSLLPERRGLGRLGRAGESVLVSVATAVTTQPSEPFLPYLIAPAFAAGLARGGSGAVVNPGFAAATLLVAGALASPDGLGNHYTGTSVEWVLVAVAAGFAGAWIRRLLTPGPAATPEESYTAAYRLLAQLRPVARELSVGLDPVTIAQSMLTALRAAVPFDRGLVLTGTRGSRLTPLAHIGTERPPEWSVDIADEDSPFAEAWYSQRPRQVARGFATPAGARADTTGLVLPLLIGVRTFGLVALETDGAPWETDSARTAAETVAVSALRLETALLFDEVRGLATAEERRRLAREIHDGIAQELSYLGYYVDSLAAEAAEQAPELEEQLRTLRAEITRIVGELRHSIFDLRSEVDARAGLGTALSEYVQAVGRSTGVTVHLSLKESDTRLSGDVEAELLRIAQEAVNNARKHAAADNLWVTLSIQPPRAVLRVEDDGRGIQSTGRTDSYGMEIMRERAGRLRARLRVEPRDPSGTLVEVTVGNEAFGGDGGSQTLT